MKLPFPISHRPSSPMGKQAAKPASRPVASGSAVRNLPASTFNLQPAQRGVALVVTLILLSVTLIMAVAFLAISRRERNAVSTTTDTATARLATQSALDAAQAQIAANILATKNPYSYGLLVSTNFQNPAGYDPSGGPVGFGPANPTNVNYDYLIGGGSLNSGQMEQNIANLWLQPRAPVYAVNRATGSNEFRFFYDLDRNNRFDWNGPVVNVDNFGNVITNGAGNPVVTSEVGDPEWIGVLAYPDRPHGPNNPFVSRYCFLAQPAGNGLDLNFIHNQTLNTSLGAADGYFRNEGVGSWELNLAAFLSDLNTNLWNPPTVFNAQNNPYVFNRPNFPNAGNAFEDARALLAWRYANNYNNLAAPSGMYFALANLGIDGFTLGNWMTNTALPPVLPPGNATPWAGSDNPNRFFSLLSDLFDASKTTVGVSPANVSSGNYLTGRLLAAGNAVGTYDRYTYYRLLSQLGTDSAPDTGKLNLNYDNTDGRGNVVPGAETNLIAWTPVGFFTNAAERLLRYHTAKWLTDSFASYREYTNTFLTPDTFGVTNIPVFVNGRLVYTPAVNRLLQLAANLYDSSVNNKFPSVFRPVFSRVGTNVFITGFTHVPSVSGPNDLAFSQPFEPGLYAVNGGQNVSINLYGVPWIIGAKKGFPAFNQLYMRNSVQMTRKLMLSRTDGLKPGPTATNQMLIMSITNRVGFSFWNSYNANYVPVNGNLTVVARESISMTLTNALQMWTNSFTTNVLVSLTAWPGAAWTASGSAPEYQTADARSFISGYFDFPCLRESAFQASLNDFVPLASAFYDTASNTAPAIPQFGLLTTNRFQAYILDGNNVIDYVQLDGPNSVRDINEEIRDKPGDPKYNTGLSMWMTNGYGNSSVPTLGVVDQINVSRFNPSGTIAAFWKAPPNMPPGFTQTPTDESAYFNGFFAPSYVYKGKTYQNTNLTIQVPYTPSRTTWEYTTWQVNDPLVHSLASDLNTTTRDTGTHKADDLTTAPFPNPTLNKVGERYQPWGLNKQMSQLGNNVDSSPYNLMYRDPLVWGSDYWDFPTNKYPTIGWIGRVHRGTPWQTVYLKASDVLGKTIAFGGGQTNVGGNTWVQWTGNTNKSFGVTFDANNSAPVHDSDLFDLFTVQFNDNATRGTLSVNQTELAAWSAVFSGVVALGNVTPNPNSSTPPVLTNIVIQPAGIAGAASPLALLVGSINTTRSLTVNPDGVTGAFEHVGDILRNPYLTERSPFLDVSTPAQQNYGLSDQVYEWLPQQVLGLLRVSSVPRYVVYCYGQALRPAPNSLVTAAGANFGLCTNYQVVAESAARAVFRVNKVLTVNGAGVVTGTNYTTTVENYNPLPPD